MSYFSLRKREPEDETETVEEEFDEAGEDREPDVEDAPEKATPASWGGAIWCGIKGPSAWLTDRTNVEASLILHAFTLWAVWTCGGWIAAGVVTLWLVAVLAFVPREYKDRVTAWIEGWGRGPSAVPDETVTTFESGAGETEPADPHATLIGWLDELTRGRAGIHLDELHQALTRHPQLAGLKRPEMRAWLDRHQVAVDRTLRVGKRAGRSGVSRTTVEALLKALPPLVESGGTKPPVHASDLPGSPMESGVERGGEHAA